MDNDFYLFQKNNNKDFNLPTKNIERIISSLEISNLVVVFTFISLSFFFFLNNG